MLMDMGIEKHQTYISCVRKFVLQNFGAGTRAPTWGSAAQGRVEKCGPLTTTTTEIMKDHLLFLLFTKSAAPLKSAAPDHCPSRPPCWSPGRGPQRYNAIDLKKAKKGL